MAQSNSVGLSGTAGTLELWNTGALWFGSVCSLLWLVPSRFSALVVTLACLVSVSYLAISSALVFGSVSLLLGLATCLISSASLFSLAWFLPSLVTLLSLAIWVVSGLVGASGFSLAPFLLGLVQIHSLYQVLVHQCLLLPLSLSGLGLAFCGAGLLFGSACPLHRLVSCLSNIPTTLVVNLVNFNLACLVSLVSLAHLLSLVFISISAL